MTHASALKKGGIAFSVVALVVVLAFVLASCAPNENTATESDSDDATITASFEWSADAACQVCHATEYASLSDSSCTVSLHSSLSCTDCHADEDGLVEAHADVTLSDTDGASRLKTTEVSEDTCLACHGSYESLAELTEDSTVLTDNEGTVVNPHDIPDVEDHEDITCTDCHEMHTSSSIEETAMDRCTDCHHQTVFECGTCHD